MARGRQYNKAYQPESGSDDEGPVPRVRANRSQRTRRSDAIPTSSDDSDEDSIVVPAKRRKPTARAVTAATASITTDLPEINDEQQGDQELEDDEHKAVEESCLKLNVDDAKLFSTDLSNLEIQMLVGKLAPSLSHENDDMAEFIKAVRAKVDRAKAPRFPDIEADPKWWSSTSPEMDALWDEAVNGEQRLFKSGIDVPTGFSTRAEHLVKPFGALADPLLVVSSYPTADERSTVHLKFATVNDVSNQSMARLYTKTGYHNVQDRQVGMMHLDIFLRRIDRKKVRGNTERILTYMPKLLTVFWHTFAMGCISRSEAMIVVLSGHASSLLYRAYLKELGIPHTYIWAFEK